MQKRERDLKLLVKQYGLDLLHESRSGSGFYRYLLQAEDGTKQTFTFPSNDTDGRQRKNDETEIKRFAQAHVVPKNTLAVAFEKVVKDMKQEETPQTPEGALQAAVQTSKEESKQQPRNMLTTKQMFQLTSWLVSSEEWKKHYTLKSLIEAAEKHFELPLTDSNMRTALEAADLKLPEAPLKIRLLSQAQPNHRTTVIARNVLVIMRHLGLPDDPDLVLISQSQKAKGG